MKHPDDEAIDIAEVQAAERRRNEESHTGMNFEPVDGMKYGRWGWTPCTVCGTTSPREKECGP
jgi:hypothetical protein